MARIVRFSEPGGPEVLQIVDEDVQLPPTGEVSIDVKAFGLNRAEALFRSGYAETPLFPSRLGYECAGTVRAIGKGVTGVSIGDAVSIVPPMSMARWGTYGEVATVPSNLLVKHPAAMSWTDAAATWMQYVTAYGALIDITAIEKSDTILVTAASSSTGIAAIQIARQVGARVIATTRSRIKAAALRDVGADAVIVTDEESLVDRVDELTSGEGVRLSFDPIGGAILPLLVEAAAVEGIIVQYGLLDSAPTPFPTFPVLAKMLTVRGYRYKQIVANAAKLEAAKCFVLGGLASGALKPVVDRVFAFEDITEAHRYLETNQQFGKIVVLV
jgi:NADPH:quinone reductase-like Zn-dependent oxidoreductase